MKRKYYILSFLLVWVNLLFADDVKFTISVKNKVATGEQFEVDFLVNANGERFVPPNFNGFQVLSGPNVSFSSANINGNTSVSNAYSFILTASTEGTYTIGPASIMVNGRRYTTNAVNIKVVKGKPVPQNSRASQSAPDDDITAGNTSDLSKSLFIRAVADKTHVYQGEQIILRYRIYTRVGIDGNSVDKLPDLNGFWSEDIKNQQQAVQLRTEVYKGLEYKAGDLKQTILFPEHAGDLTVDPLGMTFAVKQPIPSRDIMDQFFGAYKEVNYKVRSAPLIIHVKPLPETGKPADFTGAVGNFSISASVDRKELKANEPLTYSVKVSGSGNIKLLKTLNTSFPADFEKYDPKIIDTVTENMNGVSGSRIYNYLLIPRHESDFTIGPLKFSYFNPATNRYVSLSSKAFRIKVNKGSAGSNVTAFSSADKQDVKLLDKDIRYIKTSDNDLIKTGDGFYQSAGYYLLLLLGPAFALGAFAYRKREQKNNSDPVSVKSRQAGRVAAKHLANAQKQLTAKNTKLFYEDVFKGLYGYLSDKLNISYAGLNKDTIAAALKARSLDNEVVNKLLDTLDLCEMARYAPVANISEQQVFDKAKSIINDIENKI